MRSEQTNKPTVVESLMAAGKLTSKVRTVSLDIRVTKCSR